MVGGISDEVLLDVMDCPVVVVVGRTVVVVGRIVVVVFGTLVVGILDDMLLVVVGRIVVVVFGTLVVGILDDVLLEVVGCTVVVVVGMIGKIGVVTVGPTISIFDIHQISVFRWHWSSIINERDFYLVAALCQLFRKCIGLPLVGVNIYLVWGITIHLALHNRVN